jgi:hypothetical protein
MSDEFGRLFDTDQQTALLTKARDFSQDTLDAMRSSFQAEFGLCPYLRVRLVVVAPPDPYRWHSVEELIDNA